FGIGVPKMVDKEELYPVNTLPPLAWALNLYFKNDTKYRKKGVLELTFPSGKHKVKMQKKGDHEISVWFSDKKIYVRAKCRYDKKCEFNSERIVVEKREDLMDLGWEDVDSRKFFKSITKWLMKLEFDYVLLVRALVTIADKYVTIPLTTQYGRTFERFDEYRKNRWPEDAKPSDKPRFLEEILVRVCFWIQSAAEVGALKA
ncbi:MAG: hypothetical protein P1Q69_05935, partial [Candidatus Thorarchaeota archaeon]|nr:hypothetical protein [Candidatus Thorarchaeota archaeon]